MQNLLAQNDRAVWKQLLSASTTDPFGMWVGRAGRPRRAERRFQPAHRPKGFFFCGALAGLNHFSILDALTEPSHRLHELALELLGLDKPVYEEPELSQPELV